MGLDEPDPNKHRDGRRTSGEAHDVSAPAPGALSPAPAGGPCALDLRSDRRKYVLPDEHVQTVLEACARGVSEVRIARSLKINFRTWQRLRAEDERVASALAETHQIEEDELVSLLLDKARAGETTAIIFALKGRHGYRDHGAAPTSAEARVNVTINLPAAAASVEEYTRTIEGRVTP